ncbi:hypothetical protein HZH68_009678 [Vespula germanica]|uniref:Uncharacterized protein n=1 Tax=Vespula germanica TaxID=30212 RepID=A0A834N610_VESGE|nr:hypothetical protein HZH68_009678 [Vespula germanica]
MAVRFCPETEGYAIPYPYLICNSHIPCILFDGKLRHCNPKFTGHGPFRWMQPAERTGTGTNGIGQDSKRHSTVTVAASAAVADAAAATAASTTAAATVAAAAVAAPPSVIHEPIKSWAFAFRAKYLWGRYDDDGCIVVVVMVSVGGEEGARIKGKVSSVSSQ